MSPTSWTPLWTFIIPSSDCSLDICLTSSQILTRGASWCWNFVALRVRHLASLRPLCRTFGHVFIPLDWLSVVDTSEIVVYLQPRRGICIWASWLRRRCRWLRGWWSGAGRRSRGWSRWCWSWWCWSRRWWARCFSTRHIDGVRGTTLTREVASFGEFWPWAC